jgi:drug/metabolite transporter (DMT)-like permease
LPKPPSGDVGGHRRIVIAVLLFSLNPVLLRQLPLDAVTMLAAVSALAGAALVVASVWNGRGRELLSASGEWAPTLRLSVWFAANNALYLTAILKTTVANAAMTHFLAPLFVTALAPLLLRERVQRRAVVAMSLACAGVMIMMAGSGLSLDDTHFVGLLAGTASAVFFGLEIIEKKILAATGAADLIAARYLLLSTVMLLPLVDYAALLGVGVREIVVLVVIGAIAASGNVLFNTALRVVSAQHAATLAYLEPLAAVVWALLLIGEMPDRLGMAGGGLVVAGILLVLRSNDPKSR